MTAAQFHRRQVLAWAAAVGGAHLLGGQPARAMSPLPEGIALGPEQPFSWDAFKASTKALAASPWRPGIASGVADILSRIDFDAYQHIRYRRHLSLELAREGLPVQLFALGSMFREPVKIHLVEDGIAREVLYRESLFSVPQDHPARDLPPDIGFAGFRVMAPDLETDWLAFLGASYFRTSGPYNQYGISARGLAIDIGLPTAEEFPRFSEFWLERNLAREGARCTIYALLDSPSVTGAYRIRSERTKSERDIYRIAMEIEADLSARRDITRLGVAPFSSMFWYGEASRMRGADWRPEIHDSDGLAIHTGAGERLWRPLNNPPRVVTNTFIDKDVKGFGLLQRDRDFVHYLDDGVFYERRPSVWVEPLDQWGEGAVHLLEIPTDDETQDNIAAYWCPREVFRAGERRRYRYSLTWLDNIPFPPTLGRATATWTGRGGRPGFKRPDGVRKFVIDFQGPVFAGLGRNDGVEIVVTPSRGAISNAYTHPVVDQRERWRALFDLDASGPEPVDMRAFLKLGDRPITETWIYQHFPGA